MQQNCPDTSGGENWVGNTESVESNCPVHNHIVNVNTTVTKQFFVEPRQAVWIGDTELVTRK